MRPAQEWTPAQIRTAAETQVRIWHDRCARNTVRREALVKAADTAARLLVQEYGARRVWLFGSAAWGDVHERSDLDLLVEGLSAEVGEHASRAVENLVPYAVDLVLIEEAPRGLAERIYSEGRLLDEP